MASRGWDRRARPATLGRKGGRVLPQARALGRQEPRNLAAGSRMRELQQWTGLFSPEPAETGGTEETPVL
jgi:hypothetical protein